MGALHAGRLRRRRGRDRQHRPREHGASTSRPCSAPARRGDPAAATGRRDSATQTFADFVGIGVHCAQGSSVCAAANHGTTGPAARTSRAATPASTACSGPSTSIRSSSRAGPMTDLDGNVDPGRRPATSASPAFDGMERDRVACLGRADAGGGHPDHVRVHLGRARRPRHRRQHPLRVRARAKPATSSSCKDYDTAFEKFFDRARRRRHRQEQHAVRLHRRRGRPLRRRPADAGRLRRRQRRRARYNRVGEINADLRRDGQHAIRRHDAVLGPLGRCADRLRQRHIAQPSDRPGRPQPRARDGSAQLAEPVHQRRSRTTSWSRSPTTPR